MNNQKINFIIIPMAGLGEDLKKENFNTIKPLILVDNKTILEKSIKDLPDANNKLIVLNKKIYNKKLVQKILNKNRFNIFLLNKKNFRAGGYNK